MAKKGSKRSPISKDALIKENENREKRDFIINHFFPALRDATISVDEAGFLLGGIVSLIMEEAMEALKTTRMRDVRQRIIEKLCPNDERVLSIGHLVTLFDGQTLFEARGNIEGMKQVVEQIKMDEMRSKKLADVKVDWQRYLTK